MKSVHKSIFSYITKTKFEGKNSIGKFCRVSDCDIGYGSYIGSSSKIIKTKIGRFSSIGSEVRIVFGAHPVSEFISTHPSFYNVNNVSGLYFNTNCKFNEFKYYDDKQKYLVKIGNDVWIGDGAKILQGIIIGDGAIIATGAVVTKNVEPYMVVGGIPAKNISCRFDKNTVEKLLALKWWNKDIEWIHEHALLFSNIEMFNIKF